jgi:hypothetical protein
MEAIKGVIGMALLEKLPQGKRRWMGCRLRLEDDRGCTPTINDPREEQKQQEVQGEPLSPGYTRTETSTKRAYV